MARIIDGSGEHLPDRSEHGLARIDETAEVFAPGEVDLGDDVIDLGTAGSVAHETFADYDDGDEVIPDDDPVYMPDVPAEGGSKPAEGGPEDDDDDEGGFFITGFGHADDDDAEEPTSRGRRWAARSRQGINDLTTLRSERQPAAAVVPEDDAEPAPEDYAATVAANVATTEPGLTPVDMPDVSPDTGHREHRNGQDIDLRSNEPMVPADAAETDSNEGSTRKLSARLASVFDRIADKIVPDIIINLGPEALPDDINGQSSGAPVPATRPTPPPPAQWPAPSIDPLLQPRGHTLTDVNELPGSVPSLPAVMTHKEAKLDRHARKVQKWKEQDDALLAELQVTEVNELTLPGYEQSVVEQTVTQGLEYIGFGQDGPFDRQTFHGVIGAGLGQMSRGKWQAQTADITERVALMHDAESAQYAPNVTAVGVNSIIRRRGAEVATATVGEMFNQSVTPEQATQQAADLLGVELADIPFDPFGRQLTDYRNIAEIIDESTGLPIAARTDHIVTYTRGDDRTTLERVASTMLLLQDPNELGSYYLAAVEPMSVQAPSLSGNQDALGVLGAFEARAVQPNASMLLQRLMDQANRRSSGITIEDDNVRALPTTARSLDLVNSVERLVDPANIGLPMGRTYEITPEAALGELGTFERMALSIRAAAEAIPADQVEVLPAVRR